MEKKDIKEKLMHREEHAEDTVPSVEEEISVVSAKLPRLSSPHGRSHRRIGFWPDLIERCRHLPVNQAVKIKLVEGENPINFKATARAVARAGGFYLNAAYKYPFMYLWPDRMRGNVLPEDRNDKGAFIFENEKEVE